MTILTLTSSDHIYANLTLSLLSRGGYLRHHRLIIFEQHGIIPGRGILAGLLRYLSVSGWKYVVAQIVKQYLFQLVRWYHGRKGQSDSLYCPFVKLLPITAVCKTCPRLRDSDTVEIIRRLKPDVILSLFSKEFIPERIFALPRYGCLNVHPAPLPHYRGVSPTFWCLANGEKQAGVTVHVVDKHFDTGRILAQRLFSTARFYSEHALYLHAAGVAATLIATVLKEINQKKVLPKGRPQSKRGSYYSLPTKDSVQQFLSRGYKFFLLSEFYA